MKKFLTALSIALFSITMFGCGDGKVTYDKTKDDEKGDKKSTEKDKTEKKQKEKKKVITPKKDDGDVNTLEDKEQA